MVTPRAGSITIVYKAAPSSTSCINPDKLTVTAAFSVSPAAGQTVNSCIDDPVTVSAPGATKVEWYVDWWGTGSFSLVPTTGDLVGQGTPSLKSNTLAGSFVSCVVTGPNGKKVQSATFALGSIYCP